MGRTFDCIIQIYKTIKEREPKYYRESVSAYERAFLELLDTKEVTGGSNADTIEALHALFLKHLEPCDFTKAEEIYFRFGHSEDGVAEAFLKLLFSELSLKKEISFVLIESGVAETLPDCAFRRRAAQKLALLQNHKFAEQYYEIAEKYDGLSVVTGISKRDLYIPLRGRYMGRVNETSFYLEDEIDEFVQERGTANVMLLFGEAGQGKSTFVRSYFCKAFFEDKMVLLFKLADVLPSMFFGFRLRVRDFLETYGLNGEMLGGGLLILDGLDEVVGELTAKSYNLSEFINELEEELSDIAKNCKLLITSRPQGIEDRLIGYEKIKISGLSFSDQKKWILKYAGLSGNREFSEQTLLSIRSTFAELSKLMETPLLFEMIVAHGVNDNIKNRVFLFERLFKDIVNAGRPKDIHRLFERLAVEEFVEGKGSKVKEAEIKYAYHQSFVEFYHISEGVAGAEFVHRSFYQHFLGYGLVNAFLQSLSSREALVGFLKKLGKRRLEKYELDNIGWIAQREHLYLTEGQIEFIFDEIVKNNGIYASEERCSVATAGAVFVNCINLVNALAAKTVCLSGIRREVFNDLLRTYDNFGIQLTNFDLSFYILVGARLSNANLSGISMRGCDLARADLCYADLARADLNGSYLRGADLRGACLEEADLSECNLSNSYLSGGNLRGCNLLRAYLINSNMLAADLRGANLKNANMQGAILNEASYEQGALNKAIRTYEQLLAYMQQKG